MELLTLVNYLIFSTSALENAVSFLKQINEQIKIFASLQSSIKPFKTSGQTWLLFFQNSSRTTHSQRSDDCWRCSLPSRFRRKAHEYRHH